MFAYASNIDNLDALTDAVGIIAHRHVSYQIPKDSYQDVGTELLKSIKQVLGDAATEDILQAWKTAYFFLANVLMAAEDKLRSEHLDKFNGWLGYEKLQVCRKVIETPLITSFYLKRQNGQKSPKFKAGQYLGIQGQVGNETMVRNYSLSCGENSESLRISVKKEGSFSQFLHQKAEVGGDLQVYFASGCPYMKDALKLSS